MIKNEKSTINGKEYIVSLFPAVPAYLLARKLISVFTVADGNYADKLCAIDPDGELMLELLSQTTVDGTGINKAAFNSMYSGNLSEAFMAVMFVIKVNFPDFLGEGKVEALSQEITQLFPEKK